MNDKKQFKKTGEELQGFLQFRKRGYWVKNKKGKASYDRAQFKRVADCIQENDDAPSE